MNRAISYLSARRIGAGFILATLFGAGPPDGNWRYSQVYEPQNPTQQLTTTTPGLDVLENDDFAPLQGKARAAVCTAA